MKKLANIDNLKKLMMDKGRATFKAAGDLSQTNSLNDIQYPTDVFEMTGWIPLDNIVFIDLSDNKRTKELNWNFCFAIRKLIKKRIIQITRNSMKFTKPIENVIRHLEISSRPRFCRR